MKKIIWRFLIILGVMSAICLYCAWTYTPFYDGKVSIDIRNSTWKTISGIKLRFELTDIILELPELRPQERIIVVPQPKNLNLPVTKLFISYNDQEKVLINEYRPNTNNGAIVTFKRGEFTIGENSYNLSILDNLYYKPYSRVIELE